MLQSEVQKFVNAELADLSTSDERVDVKAGVRRIELTVKKMAERAPTLEARIPLSSLCTSACFSSVSSVMVSGRVTPESEHAANKENMQSLVRLHDKALDALGQDALVDAAIAKCVEIESKG